MTRPRVLFLVGSPEWSYDFNARALRDQLKHQFEIRIVYQGILGAELRAWKPALAVDFWWRGRARRLLPGVRVVKQVSSHRWQHPRYGELDARALVAKHLALYDGVLVPSERLRAELADAGGPPVSLTPKGYDPKLFSLQRRRRGRLRVGWAGNATALDKRVDLLRSAEPGLRVADRSIARTRMGVFYNWLDVITIASDAEGDPLTLIEGMACGCFPVATNVGIVPELVQHGVNGLIVEQSVGAFESAFAWCRQNVDFVRAAGRRNAELMLASRTWAHAAPAWAAAFEGPSVRGSYPLAEAHR